MSWATNPLRVSLALLFAISLQGCANLQTINRSSSVPFGTASGKVVHLDAQQRLVVFAANRYCAEPSPDALAAYASALGLSGSKLPSSSVAASGALNSMAGSIGLRTQSITLMRDTLYRTCEASLNGRISDSQVAVLMARSQDLTAVILAIEQLTGAVAAPPITLAGSGNASAANTMMANTQALSQAREMEAQAKKPRDAAEIAKNDAETAYKDAQTETERLRVEAEADTTDAAKADLLAKQRLIQEDKRKAFEAAQATFKLKEDAYLAHKSTADQIAALHDASSNQTSAGAGGLSQAGEATIYRSPNLSDAAAASISTTVEALVKTLLGKTYFNDACLAILMQPSEVNSVIGHLSRMASEQTAAMASTDSRVVAMASSNAAEATTAVRELLANQAAIKATCLKYFDALGVKALN